ARELQEAGDRPLRPRAAEESDGQDPPARPARAARVIARRSRRRSGGPPVELAFRDGVAWMTLARPGSRNRLDAELLGALADACAEIEDAEQANVAVLAARG